MFYFFKCKCLWFVYLYAVVFCAGLGVSAHPRYGKQEFWVGYREHRDPRAMLFVPLSGLGTTDNYKNILDRLDLSGVVMAPYGDHCQARPFERVSLYSGWLRYGDRMVRYLSERVLCQFGRVQTNPIHPVQSAPPAINLTEISNRFRLHSIMR